MMGWIKAAPLLLLGVMLLWTNWQRMTQQEQLIEQQQHIRLVDTQIASLTESLMTKCRNWTNSSNRPTPTSRHT